MAQQKVVKGSVYAFKDLCLKNIKVEAKKSGSSAATDSLGRFALVCEKRDKLIFTGPGFQKLFINPRKKDSIRIKMVFKEGEKNEKIAIGYGVTTKDNLTYAISHYSQCNNDFANYTDIFDLIQGKFAGVQVVNDGGKKILIRGTNSINSNIYAIYVVDGNVVSDISYISPIWIKSIDIIKGPGGAIYGSRGANGVILINTIN